MAPSQPASAQRGGSPAAGMDASDAAVDPATNRVGVSVNGTALRTERTPSALSSPPCFVHSYLDSGLGNSQTSVNDQTFVDPPSSRLPPGSASYTRESQQLKEATERALAIQGHTSSTSSSVLHSIDHHSGAASHAAPNADTRHRRQSSRPQPMLRNMRGAVEPDSDNGDESESNASGSSVISQDEEEDDDADADAVDAEHDEGEEYDESSEDDSRSRSSTRQLAETAVGVREMSKQLGRARVKSRIHSVLIITKARDNHLIKLTRELAVWLMITPRNDRDIGLTVYVDSALRQSKRFDAEGIRRDYPHIFGSASPKQTSVGTENGNETLDSGNCTPRPANGSRAASALDDRTKEDGLLRYWTSDMCSRSPHLFDFVVTLGGDGTVLFCSWLFQRVVPPVMPFALGSLGFLTNFDFKDYRKYLSSTFDAGIRVDLRMRFTATVYRVIHPTNAAMDKRRRRAIRSGKTGEIIMKHLRKGGWDSIEKPLPQTGDLRGAYTEMNGQQGQAAEEVEIGDFVSVSEDGPKTPGRRRKEEEIMCFSTRPVETFEVLNDLVVDRGPSPYVSLLEVFGDEHHLTTVQADGLCIATPTGSTAYSLSAGGSLVHPEIPAILISPICPHTLSFRPMLLPDSMELRIAVPYNSRSTAWASFDGRGRVELKQGDHIKVTASKYPFPTVCANNQSSEWFESISRTLRWNERQRQKNFVVADDDGEEEDEVPTPQSNKRQERQSTRIRPES